ncbi:MAG: hypothetical protein ACR2L2_12255 [Acidobacteriota bacterium]
MDFHQGLQGNLLHSSRSMVAQEKFMKSHRLEVDATALPEVASWPGLFKKKQKA